MISSSNTPAATIMTIDDTVENLELLEEMLASAGYRVVQFPRGELAIRAALQNPPDLILLDVMMPGMSGYHVCRILKQTEKLADIPVIFISALGDAESKVRAFTEGGVDYVTKPFQEEEVLARIRTHLDFRDARRMLEDQKAHLEELVRERTHDLNQAQKVARIGSWKLTIGDTLLELSEQTRIIMGFGKENLPSQAPVSLDKWLGHIHPDDRLMMMEAWQNSLDNPQDGYSAEYRVNNGFKTLWVHEEARFELDADGLPMRAIGTVQDVTERRIYLDALEKQNQALRNIAWTQSHVVRAPLVRLMGLVAVLEDDRFTDMDRDEILMEITASANELDGIIRDISRKADNIFKTEESGTDETFKSDKDQ
jgi:DNA-binding response OmpR family regulator